MLASKEVWCLHVYRPGRSNMRQETEVNRVKYLMRFLEKKKICMCAKECSLKKPRDMCRSQEKKERRIRTCKLLIIHQDKRDNHQDNFLISQAKFSQFLQLVLEEIRNKKWSVVKTIQTLPTWALITKQTLLEERKNVHFQRSNFSWMSPILVSTSPVKGRSFLDLSLPLCTDLF